MLNPLRPSWTRNNATIAGKSVNNVWIYCGRQTKKGGLRFPEIIALPLVKTWRNGQPTKSPTSWTRRRNRESAISSPPGARSACPCCIRGGRLAASACQANPATKTRGEWDAPAYGKFRERQGTGPGTGSGAGSEIRMRSRPATETASVVCSRAALSPRMRRHDRFSLLALPTSAASAKASRRFRRPVATFRQLLRRPAALIASMSK